MELWQWVLALLGGSSVVFILGAIVWGIFDVLGNARLDPASRIGWVLVMAFVPLFGIVAWLYAKPTIPLLLTNHYRHIGGSATAAASSPGP
jgi:hypothetical protein